MLDKKFNDLISQNPLNIREYENPTEEQQMKAIKLNITSAFYIKNLCDKAFSYVVAQDGEFICLRTTTTEKDELVAIKKSKNVMGLIYSPSKKAIELHSALWVL